MVHSIINKMTKYFSYFLVAASLFFINNLTAQPDSLFFKSKEAKKVIAPSWKMVKEVGLYLNQDLLQTGMLVVQTLFQLLQQEKQLLNIKMNIYFGIPLCHCVMV